MHALLLTLLIHRTLPRGFTSRYPDSPSSPTPGPPMPRSLRAADRAYQPPTTPSPARLASIKLG